jgi:hypothetical protein
LLFFAAASSSSSACSSACKVASFSNSFSICEHSACVHQHAVGQVQQAVAAALSQASVRSCVRDWYCACSRLPTHLVAVRLGNSTLMVTQDGYLLVAQVVLSLFFVHCGCPAALLLACQLLLKHDGGVVGAEHLAGGHKRGVEQGAGNSSL